MMTNDSKKPFDYEAYRSFKEAGTFKGGGEQNLIPTPAQAVELTEAALEAGAQALANDVWHPNVPLSSMAKHEANKFRRQALIALKAALASQPPAAPVDISTATPNATTIAALQEAEQLPCSADTAQEPPLPDGAIRAVAYIDKLPSGLWMFWSPQWRGMILAHSNPSLMFGELPTVGKRLFETMRDRHAKQPYSDASQIAQMERYKAFFADVTINEPQTAAWLPVETAPHEEEVLLGWWSDYSRKWECATGYASHGWSRNGISTISRHGQATHWQPLPAGPSSQVTRPHKK